MKVMLSYQNKAKINVLDHLPDHVNLHKQYQVKFILQFSKASKTKLEGTAEYSANSRISFHVEAGKSAERVNLTSFSHYNICTQIPFAQEMNYGVNVYFCLMEFTLRFPNPKDRELFFFSLSTRGHS